MPKYPENALVIKLKPYQREFFDSVSPVTFLKAGWATGKSLLLILVAVREMERCKSNLGVIFRKEYTDLADSTIKDFEKYTGLKVDSHRNCVFGNGSVLMFRHLEELNNIQNTNLGFVGIEQGEELDSDEQMYTLFGRLRRQDTSRQCYVIANAGGHNWIWRLKRDGLYDSVKDPDKKNRLDTHIAASSFDNADCIPESTWSLWNALKTAKPSVYNRFVLNSDDEGDTVDNIIQPRWIDEAVGKQVVSSRHIVVAVDPARYGDDESAIAVLRGGQLLDLVVTNGQDLMTLVGRVVNAASKHNAGLIVVDEIGLGAGVLDRLNELKLPREVRGINSAVGAVDADKYKNVRAEMWSKAANDFEQGRVSIPDDSKLIEQLKAVRYKTIESNGRLQVEAKSDLKKRIGWSPDRADAVVMGLYSVDTAPTDSGKDFINAYNRQVPERGRGGYG